MTRVIANQSSPQTEGKQLSSRLLKISIGIALAGSVASVVLHVVRIFHAGALWRDEIVTLNLAKIPSLSGIMEKLNFESFPIFQHLLLRVWMAGFGDADLSLRVFGGFIGVCVLGALWINSRMLGYSFPLISIILLALNPWTIQYGDSLRALGIGMISLLLTYGLVWRVTQSPTPIWIAAATLGGILCVQSLYQNAFLLLAICIGGVVACISTRRFRTAFIIVGIGGVAALSLLPYLDTFRKVAELVPLLKVPLSWDRILSVLSDALGSSSPLQLWSWVLLVILALITGFRFVPKQSSLTGSNSERHLAIFCSVTMIAGIVVFLAFIKQLGYISQPWYFLPLMALVASSIDALLIPFFKRSVVGMAVGMIILVGLAWAVLPPVLESTRIRFTNIDLIADKLREVASENDLVVVSPWYCGTTFQRYYGGDAPWTTIPPLEDYTLQRGDLLRQRMMEEDPLRPVFDSITRTLISGNRIWFVGGLAFPPRGEDPPTLPPAPKGPHGWYSNDYLVVWNLQTAHFLESHAAHSQNIPINNEYEISSYENLPLVLIHGLRLADSR